MKKVILLIVLIVGDQGMQMNGRMMEKKIYAYDIESYPNFFSVAFINVKDKEDREVFLIYRDDNGRKVLIDFLSVEVSYLVGYNNKRYDDLLLAYIFKNKDATAEAINKVSSEIINSQNGGQSNLLKQLNWKVRELPFKTIDLMKLLGFD